MVNILPLITRLSRKEIMTVRFIEKDGTSCTVRCELNNGAVNRYTITVWDLEKKAYRNIPKARVVGYY